MKLPKGLRKRKGVALILALLTTVILVTLSLAFMSLSLSEARTSRSYGYEETSVQAASYGLEYALVYMGRGNGQGAITWEPKPWDPNAPQALQFGFYNVLKAYNRGRIIPAGQEVPAAPGQQIGVAIFDWDNDHSLEAFVPGNLSEPEKTQLRGDLRRISIVDQNFNPRLIHLNSELAFTCDVAVEPVRVSRSQGRHDFRLTSTARVFQLSGGVANSTQPVATRVVEARIKESSFDYAHFIANGRTWNVNGYTPATTPKVGATDLADYVVIPKNYVEQGPMRVDGQDPTLAVPHSVMERVVGNAGNLRFLPGSDSGGVKFTHALTINQPANVYADTVTDATMTGFNAGFVPRSNRVGIPDFRTADMQLAAQYVVKDTDQSGLIQIATSQIPGARGNSDPAPKSSDPLDPFYDGTDPVVDPDGNTLNVKKPFDFRPRFPNVEITLNKNQIQIVTKSTTEPPQVLNSKTINQDQLQMGVIYVQGGNVVVKTDPTNKFQGKLSIVAGEDPSRESFTPNDSSIYSNAARAFYEYQKNQWDTYVRTEHKNPVDVANYPTPPYTVAQLRQAEALHQIPANSVESGMPSSQKLWPAPPAEKDVNNNPVKYQVEREGNVVITDDVRYNEKSGNSLGLFAQNFVLLNDTTPETPDLTIDAVLISKERAVSLDWDNTGRQNPATWKQLTSPRLATDPQRTVSINGSVIGEYIDVEGDQLGRGYKNQNFKYDLALRNANPPFMPRPDLSALPGGYRFMILHYLDRGSLSTAGILGP